MPNHLDWIVDRVESRKPDKTLHEWAQSTVEAEHIIKHLTPFEDQTILDPFMGAGTFGIAAIKLGRKFIGIEINKDHFDNASLNIDMAISNKLNGVKN